MPKLQFGCSPAWGTQKFLCRNSETEAKGDLQNYIRVTVAPLLFCSVPFRLLSEANAWPKLESNRVHPIWQVHISVWKNRLVQNINFIFYKKIISNLRLNLMERNIISLIMAFLLSNYLYLGLIISCRRLSWGKSWADHIWPFVILGAHISIWWNDLILFWSYWSLLGLSLSFTKQLFLCAIFPLFWGTQETFCAPEPHGVTGITRTPSKDWLPTS